MKRHLAYVCYVLRHKWYVFLACKTLRVPLWQALVHDWTKFLPSEWLPYARTFYNSDGSKKPYAETLEFKQAWLQHQKRNKHHWQAWLLTWDRGETEALQMPTNFIREMVADWVGAGRAITGRTEVAEWYAKNREKMILEASTRQEVEHLLTVNFER